MLEFYCAEYLYTGRRSVERRYGQTRVAIKSRGRIFTCVQPSYERAVSDLDRPMHRSLCV